MKKMTKTGMIASMTNKFAFIILILGVLGCELTPKTTIVPSIPQTSETYRVQATSVIGVYDENSMRVETYVTPIQIKITPGSALEIRNGDIQINAMHISNRTDYMGLYAGKPIHIKVYRFFMIARQTGETKIYQFDVY